MERPDVARTADHVSATRGMSPGASEYLLCIDNDRSFVVHMPASGELFLQLGPAHARHRDVEKEALRPADAV